MSTLFGKPKKKRVRSAEEEDVTGKTLAPQATEASQVVVEKEDNATPRSKVVVAPSASFVASFQDLGLADPLVQTCRSLGLKRPTPVQRAVIPFLLQNRASHVLALAPTGSGKTAAFALPLLQHLSADPYGIYAVVCSPTRELAKQIHQQILALGTSAYKVTSVLVMGGCDAVRQANDLAQQRPHFCVATPGRLAELLRGPFPPGLRNVRYLVLDEADRLLAAQSGFERDVAEILLHCNNPLRKRGDPCQTLLFSATWTESLSSLETMADSGLGRLPLHKFVLTDDFDLTASGKVRHGSTAKVAKETISADEKETSSNNDSEDDLDEAHDKPLRPEVETTRPKIPAGLKQEYIFMPGRVRDAYLVAVLRRLLANGGRAQRKSKTKIHVKAWKNVQDKESEDEAASPRARSAILFVSTCERCALVSQLLTGLGIENVALHSLLSQNRRLAALGQFQSEQVRILVSTDVGSRGLDIPSVDLVVNVELPRQAVNYIHRVGRTARAGRRGRAVSLVAAEEVSLVHAAERLAGRPLEKCVEVTDDDAMPCLGPVMKATRVAKMKLQEIGFDDLVHKFRERKVRDRKDRQRIQKALRRQAKRQKT